MSGMNNQGEYGSGTPHMSKKDRAMYQQELQSAVPQVESIPSVKVIECASDKADVKVSTTEWINSLSEPLHVERGSALTVNASFLQSRGIQNDLIDFNKSGNNRNDSTLMDYTYYTVNDGTNDKKSDVDLHNYYFGNEDSGYTYKKSLLYRWGAIMNEYSTNIGGDGCGIKKIETIGRDVVDTGKPDPRLAQHPYIECASRVGVKEDQNSSGYFYNNECEGKDILFQQNGISWFEGKTYQGNPVKNAFFIFGYVPHYANHEGVYAGDDGDRSFMLSLRQGIVDIGYEYNTYFQGRPLAPQSIRKYPCGYLGSSGTNIHIEITPVDNATTFAKFTDANMSNIASWYKNHASGIGGTYCLYKTVKLNEPEKNYLLTNYPNLYTQEELDNANFHLFDPTRGNFLRPNGFNAEIEFSGYMYVGCDNDGHFRDSASTVDWALRINQSYYYMNAPDGAVGSRIGYWRKKYNNTKPFEPFIHEYTFPQIKTNQDPSTAGATQMYRYFGNSPSSEDQYDQVENGNPLAMIQKYDSGFNTETTNSSLHGTYQSTSIKFIIDGTGVVVSGITVYKHKVEYTYDATVVDNNITAFRLIGKMCSINSNTANENAIIIGNMFSVNTATPSATVVEYELVAINLDNLIGGNWTYLTCDWNFDVDNTADLPSWLNATDTYTINWFDKEYEKGFDCRIVYSATNYDIPITKESNFFGRQDPNFSNIFNNYPELKETDFYDDDKNTCYEGGCVWYFAQNYQLLYTAMSSSMYMYDDTSLSRFQFGNNERIIHTINAYTDFINQHGDAPNPDFVRTDPSVSKNWDIEASCCDYKINHDWLVMRNSFFYETAKNYMSATDIGNDFTFKTHELENAVDYETGNPIENTILSGIVQNRFCIPVWTSNDSGNYPSYETMTVPPSTNLQETGGYYVNSFKARTYYKGAVANDFATTGVSEGTYNLWFRMGGLFIRWYDPAKQSTEYGKFTIKTAGTGYTTNQIVSFNDTVSSTEFFQAEVSAQSGGVPSTVIFHAFITPFTLSTTNTFTAVASGGSSGLEIEFISGERPSTSVPVPLKAYVSNTETSLGEALDGNDFKNNPQKPTTADRYYSGKQGDSGLEPAPSGTDPRFYMMEEPFMELCNPAYPIVYSPETNDRGESLKATQMCGTTNFSLQYNEELSIFEYVFLHTPYATEFNTDTATGGNNSVKVIYPAQEGVENFDCHGGINITSWARPNYVAGSFTNEQVQDNTANYWSGFSSGINPNSNAYDEIGERFMDKLGFDFDDIQSRFSGISSYDFDTAEGNMIMLGTTGNDLDIASSVIATREATETEPRLENHKGGLTGVGAPNRFYGDLIVAPYSFDSATQSVDTSDNHAGVKYIYAGGTFASVGGERMTNNIVSMGMQNTTGSQLKYDMLTAPKTFDPCHLGKWTSYTVACGSSSIKGTQLPEKTTNGYFLVVSDIIDSEGFILSLNGGSPSNIVAIIMKNYTSSDFIISYQSPIELYFPKDVIISQIRTKIIDNNFEPPVNIGKNSAVIYAITNQNPSIERKFASIEDIQQQDYQLMDLVNNQIKASVGKSGMGIMQQTAADINSLSTSLTRPSDAMTHPLAQIRNKILQFDLPAMSEAEKHRFMTETQEGQVLQDDIADFNIMNNAVEEVVNPVPQSTALGTPIQDEGIAHTNAGQTELRADDLRKKLKGAIRQTQRQMSRRGISAGQFTNVGEGQAIRNIRDATQQDFEAYQQNLKDQRQRYTDETNNYILSEGLPTLEGYEEFLGATNMSKEQIKEEYERLLREEHRLPSFDDYQKALAKRGEPIYTNEGLEQLQKKVKRLNESIDIGGRTLTLEGEAVGQVPRRNQDYLLQPTVLQDNPRTLERLSGHYSFGMKGQEDLSRKERIEKANNQESLTREREYDIYYKKFKPTSRQAQPLSFKDYQLDKHGNAYGLFRGRPTELVAEQRRRRGQVETEISTMGDVNYRQFLKDMGDKSKMKEIMNRIAPEGDEENPFILPSEFDKIRQDAFEQLATAPKRSEAGRSESGIGSSIAPSSISEASGILGSAQSVSYGTAPRKDVSSFFQKRAEDLKEKLSEHAAAQPSSLADTVETKVAESDYEPIGEPEPLEVAKTQEKPKSKSSKLYTSKRGLLSGRSKLFRYIGDQEQLKFTSKDNKKRAEEIASSFKLKFAQERAGRGRLAQQGTQAHTNSTATERRLYNEMVGQMQSEGLLHTPQTQTETPQAPQPQPQIPESSE